MPTLELILRAQRRVVRTQQAIAAGLTRGDIASLTRRGEWTRQFRGIYSVEPAVDDPFVVRCRAALLFAGADAAISHRSALSLLAGRVDAPDEVHVSVQSRNVLATPGLVAHWVAVHGPRALVRGVECVSPPAAVVGAWADLVSPDERRSMLCAAVSDLRIPVPAITSEMSRPIRIRGRKALESACGLITLGCHSVLEMHYYEGVERAFRLPPGSRQRAIRVRSGRVYRVDVMYEAQRVIVELDGSAHRATAEARHADLLRDAELQAAGYLVLRFTWSDVLTRPEWVAASVRAALATQGIGVARVVSL